MPLNASNSDLVIAHTDSGAESIARRLPSAHVVASFQATPSELLLDVFEARGPWPRPNIVYCGDDIHSKERYRASCANRGRACGRGLPACCAPRRAIRNARNSARLWARRRAEMDLSVQPVEVTQRTARGG